MVVITSSIVVSQRKGNKVKNLVLFFFVPRMGLSQRQHGQRPGVVAGSVERGRAQVLAPSTPERRRPKRRPVLGATMPLIANTQLSR